MGINETKSTDMPQSERLEVHSLLDELEEKPLLRKQLMSIIIEEMNRDSEFRKTLERLIVDTQVNKTKRV